MGAVALAERMLLRKCSPKGGVQRFAGSEALSGGDITAFAIAAGKA